MSMYCLVRINATVKKEHRTKMNPSKLLMDLEPFKDLTGIKLYKRFAASEQLLNCVFDWDGFWDNCDVDKRVAVPNTYQVETGELQFSGYFNFRYLFDWTDFNRFVFKELFEKITLCFMEGECDFDEHGIYDGDFDEACKHMLHICLNTMQEDWSEYLHRI